MMGMKISTDHMGPLGYVLASAPTLGRALQNFVVFQRVLNGGLIVWNVSSEPGRWVVRLTTHAEVADIAWVLEAPITLILKIARELSGHRVVPQQVSFRHPPPQDTTKYEEFHGIPIVWSAADNELVLPDSVLDLPIHTADRVLYPTLLNALDARPQLPPPPSTIVQNTQVQILKEISKGTPDGSTISRVLGMTPSTLFRRLREAGTSFDALVDRTRREKTIEYLADATIALGRLGRVADRLGYSEHSAFFRAFVR
jgi:AraC-like DNA-binding protein